MSEFFDIDRPRNRPGRPTHNGREHVEVRSAQAARDMARNKALPLTAVQRDELKKIADRMEQDGSEY